MKKEFLSPYAKRRVAKARKAKKSGKAAPSRKRRVIKGKGIKPTVVKQEGLGQQTMTKMSTSIYRKDTRAHVMKQVGAPSFYNRVNQYTLLSADPTSGIGYTGIQAVQSYYNTNQITLNNIANQLANTNGYGAAPQPSRFLLEHATLKYSFSNNSTAPCVLRLYVISNKRDIWNPPSGNTLDQMTYVTPLGTAYPWTGQPENGWKTGLQAQGNLPPTGADLSQVVGVLPTECKLFNDFFKIERFVEIEMATGGVHHLELNRSFDKVCDASVYSSTPLVALRGLTQWVLAVAYGAPVRVTSGAASGTMTTAVVNIGVVESQEYRYTQSYTPLTSINAINNLGYVQNSFTATINSGSGAAGAPQIV